MLEGYALSLFCSLFTHAYAQANLGLFAGPVDTWPKSIVTMVCIAKVCGAFSRAQYSAQNVGVNARQNISLSIHPPTRCVQAVEP